jgi:hypothetical protein
MLFLKKIESIIKQQTSENILKWRLLKELYHLQRIRLL